ncbi:MAG TPA: segregation/condensation protein A [Acetobacteraceae bacterium]|nr:segregation/condensation protein A [Acetobacteraceae bacterium]
MDGRAADPVAGTELAKVPSAEADGTPAEGGQGSTPLLALNGFSGPLERLLALARAQAVDLSRLSLPVLVDQLATALRQAVPLGQKGDWVVMAAWLLLLRSHLLLPPDAVAAEAADRQADQLRDRLVGLREMQALADWLEQRPQLGRDVFARGQPELLGTSIATDHEIDVIEFLWASLALFEDPGDDVETAAGYRQRWFDLYPVAEARARILRLLDGTPEAQPLDRLLPELVDDDDEVETPAGPALRRRAAWSSTLIASLELAKQGDLTLAQENLFTPIHVSPVRASPPA